MTDEHQTVHEMQFPAHVDVPDNCWQRGKTQDGNEFWIFGKEGYLEVAHQSGLESIDCEFVDAGADQDGIRYAAAKTTVVIDGQQYSAIGSIDETENSLSDMFSTAETRALKRAIARALNIRAVNPDPEEPRAEDPTDREKPDRWKKGHGDEDEEGDETETAPAPTPAVDAGGEW